KRDYYEVLEVSRSASAEEIKRSYRRLARQHHPDISKELGAEERFKEIAEAYEILSDTDKRAAYDRFGHAAFQAGMGGAGYDPFADFGLGDIFESFFGGMSGRTRSRTGPQQGRDLRYVLSLEFEEAIFGCEKEIEVPRLEVCDACRGTGAEPGTQPTRCPTCQGTGEVRQVRQSFFGQFVNVTPCTRCQGRGEIVNTPCRRCNGESRRHVSKTILVTIPAGVEDGMQIRLSGEGEAGLRGGPAGHLYVALQVKAHNYFQRDGQNIVLEWPLNFAQAALGDEIEVPTVDGAFKLVVPAATQTGATFRIKDKGVPRLRGTGRGDQIVITHVLTPTDLTDEQRSLLLQLGETLGQEITPQRARSILDKVKDALGM
ncbi:MAG: molecular chaperone DnaJ, partial [Chloroflexi bacterium]|nr:molecular chaperone DnaJ [Chloroflexota bacterium]